MKKVRKKVDREVRLNPEWTNTALYRQWDEIVAKVGPEWMPKLNKRTSTRLKAIEYGTGAYGTVMPTSDPRVVVKVTSDDTEAEFVALVLEIGEQPEGLVRYEDIYRLEGSRDGNPIYILWREDAHRVGDALNERDREDSTFLDLLISFRVLAQTVFWYLGESDDYRADLRDILRSAKKHLRTVDISRYTDPDRTERYARNNSPGKNLAAAVRMAEKMSHDPVGYAVGDAIDYYLSQGVLLSDIHDGNLGWVTRGDEEVMVITDPGQVVLLKSKWEKVRVPRLSMRRVA